MGITIIIPIRDTGIKYFEKCLYSLNTQAEEDFAVTVVNDGSKVENVELYLKAVEEIPRFPIEMIHTGRPIGPGPARQYGVDKTSFINDFLFFLDSDDMLYPNTLRALLSEAIRSSADTVHGKIYGEKAVPEEDKAMNEAEVGGRVAGILYRKELLDKYDIRFLDKKMVGAEDSYYALVVANLAGVKKYIDIPLYYWRYNPDSITRTKDYEFAYVINVDHAFSQYAGGNKIMEYFPDWNFGGTLAVLFNNYQYALVKNASDQMEEIAGYAEELLSRPEVREHMNDEHIMDWVNKYTEVLKKVETPKQSFLEWRQEILDKIDSSAKSKERSDI